jgi:hypothetical protein
MNTKILLCAFVCGCLATAGMAQTDSIAAGGQDNVGLKTLNGVWVFDKAVFTAYQYGTDSPIETINIRDVNSLDTAGFHFQTVFRKVEISGGQISVVLGNRDGGVPYRLEDGQLVLANEKEKEESKTAKEEELPATIMLQPYEYAINGDRLQFTFDKYSYGDSRFDFSLEGKLSVTLVKDKSLINL